MPLLDWIHPDNVNPRPSSCTAERARIATRQTGEPPHILVA